VQFLISLNKPSKSLKALSLQDFYFVLQNATCFIICLFAASQGRQVTQKFPVSAAAVKVNRGKWPQISVELLFVNHGAVAI